VGGYFLAHYEREQSEAQALSISEGQAKSLAALLQAAFHATGVLVIIFDRSRPGVVSFANETAQALLDSLHGHPGASVRLVEELCSAERDGVQRLSQRAHIEGNEFGAKSSRAFSWTLARAKWVSAEAGIAIGFDRTEIEAAEQALYQQSRLTSLGELVTGLSHELSQPLTVISFAASMINKDTGGEGRELADLLAKATERVAHTVERMKVFGRRSIDGTKSYFSLVDCLENVELLTRNELKLANIVLAIEGPAQDLMVTGDLVLFEQVLLNMVLNARDAIVQVSDPSRPRVVRIAIDETDSAMVRVEVSDTGPGIPGEILSRVFDPFFTTKVEGSGLGLSLSFGIIKEMGGRVSVTSTREGATFGIVIPRA
jgi:signal transduction histidine kinase